MTIDYLIEKNVRKCIKELLYSKKSQRLLKESDFLEVTSEPNTIYHALAHIEDIESVKHSGLKPQGWDAVFWSNNTAFAERCTLLLSLRLTRDNIKKYCIRVGNPVSYSYKAIPYNMLKISDCRIGEAMNLECTMASVWKRQKLFALPLKRLCELMDELDFECIYEDVYRYFFGQDALEIIKRTGIEIRTLGI